MISPVKIWRNQKKLRQLLGKKGLIVSFTIIRQPPAGFESQAPYAAVIVDLAGTRVTGQLVDIDLDQVKIGQKVQAIVRRTKQPHEEGLIPYGIKFKQI